MASIAWVLSFNFVLPALQFRSDRLGRRLAYVKLGRGPVLVVPPGWISHVVLQFQERDFAEFYGALAERFTVVLYDRRGTGSSDRGREDYGIECDLEDLETIISAVADGPVSLFGLSYGGPISIAYTARRPDRIRRLVLVGTFANGTGLASEEVQRSLVALVRAHWGLGSRMLADLFVPGVEENARVVLWFARMQRECASAETAARLLESVYRTDVSPLLARIRTPSLVVHRRGDRVMPARLGRELAAGLPDARLALLEGNLHLPWMGQARQIIELILSFLEAAGVDAAAEPAAVGAGGRREGAYEVVNLDLVAGTGGTPRPRIGAGLAQLDVPLSWLEPRGDGLVGLASARVEDLAAKVRRVVEEGRRQRVDLLLMPELAVDLEHAELQALLLALAAETGMIIVPGSFHLADRRANVARVFGPRGVLWEQEKQIPAMIRLAGDRFVEGIMPVTPRRLFVADTALGRIAIVICRDFLDLDLRVELRHASPPVDILLNPALTPVTEDFEAAHLESRRSLYAYSFFCNVSEFGHSLVYSPEKGKSGRASRRRLPAGKEGLIVKEVDLFGLREARRAWEETRAREKKFIQSTR